MAGSVFYNKYAGRQMDANTPLTVPYDDLTILAPTKKPFVEPEDDSTNTQARAPEMAGAEMAPIPRPPEHDPTAEPMDLERHEPTGEDVKQLPLHQQLVQPRPRNSNFGEAPKWRESPEAPQWTTAPVGGIPTIINSTEGLCQTSHGYIVHWRTCASRTVWDH